MITERTEATVITRMTTAEGHEIVVFDGSNADTGAELVAVEMFGASVFLPRSDITRFVKIMESFT